MLLAVNFSPEAAELVAAGAIACDYFKVPDWDEVIAAASELKPVEVHFPLQLGSSELAGTDLGRVADLMATTGTTRLNLHVAPSRERFPEAAVGANDRALLTQVTSGLLEDLEPFVERFGAANLILENLPYRGPERGLLRAGVEPELLTDLLGESGAGLLLDLSHAVITAETLGERIDDYLARLPLGSLADLHVSGVRVLDGRSVDHLPLTPADWELLEAALGHIAAGRWARPRSVTLEYGGVGPVFSWRTETDVLTADLPRLARLVEPLRGALN